MSLDGNRCLIQLFLKKETIVSSDEDTTRIFSGFISVKYFLQPRTVYIELLQFQMY